MQKNVFGSLLLIGLLLLCSCGKVAKTTTSTTSTTTTTTSTSTSTTTSTTTTTIQDVSVYLPAGIGKYWYYNESKVNGTTPSSAIATYENIAVVDTSSLSMLSGTAPSTAVKLNLTAPGLTTYYFNSMTSEVMYYAYDSTYSAYLPFKLIRTPFAVGETWIALDGTSAAGRYLATAEVLSYGPITVNGFSYNAYKVNIRMHDSHSGILSTNNHNYWFVANLGMVKIETFGFNNGVFLDSSTKEIYDYN